MSSRRQEILGILLIALGLLVLLSLVSYNPIEEPTISKNIAIQNWMGIVGVYIAHYLIKYTLGVAVGIFPVLMLIWGWWMFAAKEQKILVRFSLYIIFLALIVSVTLGLPAVHSNIHSDLGFRYSGLIGGIFAKVMHDFLGFIGTIITLLVMALITIRGYFTWSFYGPIEKLLDRRRLKLKKATAIERSAEPEPVEQIIDKVPAEKESHHPLQIKKPVEPEPAEVRITPAKEAEPGVYQLPALDLLEVPAEAKDSVTKEEMAENAQLLENALETFGVRGKVVHVSPGPIITRYEIEPATGVRVSKIAALADDLARILSAKPSGLSRRFPGNRW
jgi:S-DNA-T family DNA segregation ATPase FtsK/SpoIIIE